MTNVVVENAEAVAAGTKTALICVVVPGDRYRIGNQWRQVGDYADWTPGWAVDEVKDVVKSRSHVGQVIGIRSFSGEILCHVAIEKIEMAEFKSLPDEAVQALGYPSQAAYMADLGYQLRRRRGWLKYVHLVPEPVKVPDELSQGAKYAQ